jgi:thioredoxin reductase (NADPH)
MATRGIKSSFYRINRVIMMVAAVVVLYLWYRHHSTPLKYSLSPLTSTQEPIAEVAIIGSGPAGLSAALYTARAHLHTIVFEGKTPGGQLTKTSLVENWPGIPHMMGADIINGLRQQARFFGATTIADTIEQVDVSTWPFTLWTSEGTVIKALSLIIANGANPRILGVPGEDTYWGKGVTTCAICDAPFYKGSDVVVIGGGDSAIEQALQLAEYAKNITLLVRSSHMRASSIMQDRLKDYPHITIQYNATVTRIIGDQEFVTHIEIKDDDGIHTLPIDGVFLAIGHIPNTELFKNTLKCDNQGYILLTDRTQRTSIPGIFAAGDVEDSIYRQAGVAAGSGIRAALDAERFLREHDITLQAKSLSHRFYSHTHEPLDFDAITDIATEADLQKQIADSNNKTIILDFFAPYCPSCIQMLPSIQSIAELYKDRALFLKVDTSASLELAERYIVPSIPCLLVFKEGKIVARTTDIMSKQELESFINQFL